MSNPRWKQRLENLKNAFARLEEACALEKYSDLERAGLIQTFEFTFELCWKTLKNLLNFEGFAVNSPREVLRKAYAVGFVDDLQPWLQALESRNLLSHTYNEQRAEQAVALIKETFMPMLEACVEKLRMRADSDE